MDFTVAVGAPPAYPLKINGTDYKVPRFLLPAFKEWQQKRAKEQMDAAVAELSDENEKARFRLYYQAVPQDVAQLGHELRTPDGIEYGLRYCLEKGEVPPEVIEAMLTNAPAKDLLALWDNLSGVNGAVAKLKADSQGEGSDPKNPSTNPPPT